MKMQILSTRPLKGERARFRFSPILAVVELQKQQEEEGKQEEQKEATTPAGRKMIEEDGVIKMSA